MNNENEEEFKIAQALPINHLSHPLGDDYLAVKELIEHHWELSIKQAEEIEKLKKTQCIEDARKELRAVYHLAWIEEFGPESMQGPRERIKSRIWL